MGEVPLHSHPSWADGLVLILVILECLFHCLENLEAYRSSMTGREKIVGAIPDAQKVWKKFANAGKT